MTNQRVAPQLLRLMATMSSEKALKDHTELPPPAATPRFRYPHRLRNALALTAACGLVYLGISSWNVHKNIKHVDPLVSTSDAIHQRNKGFGFDAKKSEHIYL